MAHQTTRPIPVDSVTVAPPTVAMSVHTLATGRGHFLPSDFTQLKFWAAASFMHLQEDNRVGTLNDFSGFGFDVTQSTDAAKPIFKPGVLNGLPVIRFDGVDDALTKSAFTDLGPDVTVYAVAAYAAGGDADQAILEVLGASVVNSGYNLLHEAESKWAAKDTNKGTLQRGVDGDLRDGTFRIHEGITRSNANVQYYVNGSSQGTSAYSTNGNTLDELQIGRLNFAGYFLQGDIAEVIIYNRSLQTSERSQVQSYLNSKYSLY